MERNCHRFFWLLLYIPLVRAFSSFVPITKGRDFFRNIDQGGGGKSGFPKIKGGNEV